MPQESNQPLKLQTALRFACFFAVNLAASLHAAGVTQFAAACFCVAENVGQPTVTVQRIADFDPGEKQFSRDRAG